LRNFNATLIPIFQDEHQSQKVEMHYGIK